MSDNWPYKIQHVVPGEPVQAGIVGRPDRALADRTEYLKDRLDAAEAGKALFDAGATVSSDVLPGHAVYWNSVSQRYERALVLVEDDPTTGTLLTRPSSDCVGLCYRKLASDKADIVLRGLVTFDNLDNAIGPTVAPGKYYLSAVDPGKLSTQKPPITVTVCYVQGPRDNCSDALRVIVAPQVRDFLDEHTHYRFNLVARPAGTLVGVPALDPVTIEVTPDVNLYGWLPAGHVSFNGTAPANAAYGYNLKKHTALSRVWPPIPIQSVSVLWDKGEDLLGATEVPMGATGLVVCDVNGIWWMSNCRGDVPWPENYATLPLFPETNLTANSESLECPRGETMRLVLVFLRMLLGNDRRVVTSLDTADGSPIVIANCDNLPATTGDLVLDLDLQQVDCAPIEDDDPPVDTQLNRSVAILGYEHGGKVFNDVLDTNDAKIANRHKLKKNWVTEGVIVPAGTRLLATGSWKRTLTAAEKTYHNFASGDTVYAQQGLIKLTLDDTTVEREIFPQIIRLNDAVERLYNDIPYLGFPYGQESSLRLRLLIPYIGIQTGVTLSMKMRVQMFTRGGFANSLTNIGNLTASRRILPPPGSTGTINLNAPEEAPLVFPQNVQAKRDWSKEVDSGSFTVQAGDTVLVTIGRAAADTGGNNGELGILRVSGILTGTAT